MNTRQFFIIKIFLLFYIFFFCLTQVVRANELVFSDNFSTGLNKWQLLSGQQEMWFVSGGKLYVDVRTVNTITELAPQDDLWDDNWQEYSWELDFATHYGVDKNFVFGYAHPQSWWELHFNHQVQNLVQVENGQVVLDLQESADNLEQYRWYHLQIVYLQNKIQIFLDNILIAQTLINRSVESSPQKIVLKAATGVIAPLRVVFDNIRVTQLGQTGEKILDLAAFQQHDPSWADLEYDSASQWVEEEGKDKIRNWGCAISSLAMVMNYYGLDTMPNGQAVNPQTLNEWFNDQADGYLGDGYLNWAAAMRLVKRISQKYSTDLKILPKLEYSYVKGASFTPATDEIAQNRPVILQIEGHFLLSNGYTEDQTDLYILDPAFIYEKLSQHDSQLLSTRVFTPSQTDLSYLVLVVDATVELELRDAAGEDIALATEDQIISPEGLTQPKQKVYYLPKPDLDSYQIKTKNLNSTSDNWLKIYVYDQEAEVQILEHPLVFPNNSETMILNFQPESQSSLETNQDWYLFRQNLLAMLQDGVVKKHYVYRYLDRIASYAQQYDSSSNARYAGLLTVYVEQHKLHMTPAAYDFLLENLAHLAQINP